MIGNLAVRTGIWPLKEYVDGHIVHTMIPRTRVPVEEYLEKQERFGHLFASEKGMRLIRELQASVDDYRKGIPVKP